MSSHTNGVEAVNGMRERRRDGKTERGVQRKQEGKVAKEKDGKGKRREYLSASFVSLD